MAQQYKIGKVATTVSRDAETGVLRVTYHATDVVKVWPNGKIVLDSGGWRTHTTKTRMNQASHQLGLGFMVWQKDYAWFVDVDGHTQEFRDGQAIRNGRDYGTES